MYILTFISFKLLNNIKNSIILNTILIILYILFLSIYKETHWYNTLSCYLFGMLFCYKKDAIEKVLFNNFNYIIILTLVIISFILMRHYAFISFWYFELYAILFIMLLLLISIKISFNSKILSWFGNNIFWIYILQRIPMMIFQYLGYHNHAYRYSLVVFISTMLLAFLYKFIFDKQIDKITNYLNNKVK